MKRLKEPVMSNPIRTCNKPVALLCACAPAGARNWPFSIDPQTYAVALGDLDGDGDLDAFLANEENEVPVANTVWLNDGRGHFQQLQGNR